MNGVSVKGKFASFSPGALHLLVMETALKYKPLYNTSRALKYKPLQNTRTNEEKIKEEDQKSLNCRELGLVKPC